MGSGWETLPPGLNLPGGGELLSLTMDCLGTPPPNPPSSLSQWVHACDALELKPQDREQLDAFIDQLYKDIEAGW
jgi:hypothetical protein